jgi:hypothetical protein
MDKLPDDITLLIYKMVTQLKMVDVMDHIKFIKMIHERSYPERRYHKFYAEWYFTDCSSALNDIVY